ncbi:hypothetical protein [Actinomadura rubrisoli]|nr:hypothetical protein [Actinomadura rubrisoli]
MRSGAGQVVRHRNAGLYLGAVLIGIGPAGAATALFCLIADAS